MAFTVSSHKIYTRCYISIIRAASVTESSSTILQEGYLKGRIKSSFCTDYAFSFTISLKDVILHSSYAEIDICVIR